MDPSEERVSERDHEAPRRVMGYGAAAAFAATLCVLGALGGVCLGTYYVSPRTDIAIDWATEPPVVAIRSIGAGRYVELFGADGVALAAGRSATAPGARFRMLSVGAGTVTRLREQAAAHEWAMASHKMQTRSGCRCTGFSNGHGFGRYCHGWESAWEDPWCYVNETCSSATVKRGSFGRNSETCTSASPPPPPPSPPSPPPPPPPPSPPPSPADGWFRKFAWAAPPGCTCCGFTNKHGFGASCEAW
jgi:hypothetical protein